MPSGLGLFVTTSRSERSLSTVMPRDCPLALRRRRRRLFLRVPAWPFEADTVLGIGVRPPRPL